MTVLAEVVLVRICKEQILVPEKVARKGKMKEEMKALTVSWVSEGIDCCRIGFLPQVYTAQGRLWDDTFCRWCPSTGSITTTVVMLVLPLFPPFCYSERDSQQKVREDNEKILKIVGIRLIIGIRLIRSVL